MHAYRPRPRRCLGLRDLGGWMLKHYEISVDGLWPDEAGFGTALALAEAALPQPPLAPGRLGVGFLILHRGRDCDYLVLAWWDRENELPLRVFVRPHGGGDWRAARDGESFCVWDLEVIGFERDAYVATVLSASDADLARADYLVRLLPDAAG
ncbi:isochorismatase [Rehaibacterium terrae]|uniref:Uncharacterized protein n=1 Tax=Rehaibacterium terrae TaxID=1341696 RepID=A0A7W7XY59_9GAMM|nr:isochorismatase [Rehaibacterium terrae]MBB5014165.1 hypothetical protein [Rehaibacterium terrae]